MKNAKRLNIRIHGHGGDGVVTAAKILAWGVIEGEGKNAQMFPTFGPERSGAPVVCSVRICERPLPIPIENPDIIVVFKTALKDDGVFGGIGENSVVIVDSPEPAIKIAKALGRPIWSLDASGISKTELGKALPGIALFGALVKATGIVGRNSMFLAIRNNIPKKNLRGNLRAAHRGFEAVRTIGELSKPCVCLSTETPAKPAWNEIIPGAVQTDAGNSRNYKTGGWGISLPVIDLDKCKMCMICWAMCPENSFRVMGGKLVLDEEHCKGCGVCSEVCPKKFDAIKMEIKKEKQNES
ncbi:MAG: 2-oxoacid:acceptor oxidoreductase family protein [bacterium]|nr:2-oxoacid:acceptor oxidoreductase family protein [bacterium]